VPFNLDLSKVVVIMVFALIVLGPERLPQAARTLGALWRDLVNFRERVSEEVSRHIPPVEEVKSPLSFLSEIPRPSELLALEPKGSRARDDQASPGESEASVPARTADLDPFSAARKVGEFPLTFLPADPRLN
jgi:sec-independent protein translocase protein TatB